LKIGADAIHSEARVKCQYDLQHNLRNSASIYLGQSGESRLGVLYKTTRIDGDMTKDSKTTVVTLSLLPPAICLLPSAMSDSKDIITCVDVLVKLLYKEYRASNLQ